VWDIAGDSSSSFIPLHNIELFTMWKVPILAERTRNIPLRRISKIIVTPLRILYDIFADNALIIIAVS